jgi:hypothetical protein
MIEMGMVGGIGIRDGGCRIFGNGGDHGAARGSRF